MHTLFLLAAGEVPYVSGGTAVVGVVAIATLFWKIQRSIIAPLEYRVDEERDQREICEWRQWETAKYLREHHGIAIPDAIVFGMPPDVQRRIEERRRTRRFK